MLIDLPTWKSTRRPCPRFMRVSSRKVQLVSGIDRHQWETGSKQLKPQREGKVKYKANIGKAKLSCSGVDEEERNRRLRGQFNVRSEVTRRPIQETDSSTKPHTKKTVLRRTNDPNKYIHSTTESTMSRKC